MYSPPGAKDQAPLPRKEEFTYEQGETHAPYQTQEPQKNREDKSKSWSTHQGRHRLCC